MRFTIVTLFPEYFQSALSVGVVGNAIESGKIKVEYVNPRTFTTDVHKTVDDKPYGGGPGMVMMCEPVVSALQAATEGSTGSHTIAMSAAGSPFSTNDAKRLSEMEEIVLVCGRYEGLDQRILDHWVDEEISLGDFVLSGGEPAAACVIDAIARFVPGVLGKNASLEEESFAAGLLEYPHYTRPGEFRDHPVPEVLLGGNHGEIANWRLNQSLERTAQRRPELLPKAMRKDFQTFKGAAAHTSVALLHYPVFDRAGNTVTTSITNLDLHDSARLAATYGLDKAYIVTPVGAQREKVDGIRQAWANRDEESNRVTALEKLSSAESLQEVIGKMEKSFRMRPIVVGTSAQSKTKEGIASVLTHLIQQRPVLLVFGTGWGLLPEVLSQCDVILPSLEGPSEFVHLSVRSAIAIYLDRLFGNW